MMEYLDVKKSSLVLISALLLMPAPMAAQTATGARELALSDFQAKRRARLMEADTDRDGRLSAAEWTARSTKARNPERRFARLDTNRDNYLDPRELDAQIARVFAKRDADRDGRISREERAARRNRPAATANQ